MERNISRKICIESYRITLLHNYSPSVCADLFDFRIRKWSSFILGRLASPQITPSRMFKARRITIHKNITWWLPNVRVIIQIIFPAPPEITTIVMIPLLDIMKCRSRVIIEIRPIDCEMPVGIHLLLYPAIWPGHAHTHKRHS